MTDTLLAILRSFLSIEGLLLLINTLLLIFSRGIIERLNKMRNIDPSESRLSSQLKAFRAANIVLILFVFFFQIVAPVVSEQWFGSLWVTRLLAIFLVGYMANLLFHFMAYLVKKRFGKTRLVNGDEVLIDTYNSRALELLVGFLIAVIALISSIRILGFDSLLEAGGVVGFLGVILALTQGSWAPDIISGLIILNSNFLSEGDVIELEGSDDRVCSVFKTKMFHTELLDLRNNHRIMMRNAQLRDHVIHNLSKFASAKGLREILTFQIGYDEPPKRVLQLFKASFEEAANDTGVAVEGKFPMEVVVEEAGADAVEWGIYFYTRSVRDILNTRHAMRQIILKKSLEMGISLATPRLHVVERLVPEGPVL